MKRYRYIALAAAVGAIALTPGLGQAATPMDLEFHSYRSIQQQNRSAQPHTRLLNGTNLQDHGLRNKLVYID